MAYIVKKGASGFPSSGATIHVHLAGTATHATGLTDLAGNAIDNTSGFVVPTDANTGFWGFEPATREKLDVWWVEGNKYLVEDAILKDPYQASDVGAVPLTRTINGLPLSSDIVIDAQGGFVSHYHFCEDVIFAGTTPQWHELESQSDGGAIGQHTATGSAYSEMDRYVTDALNTTVVPAGDWSFTLYAKCSVASREGMLRAQIYRVNSVGTIVGSVLGTAESATFTNTNVVGIKLSCFIAEQTGWALTDRIGVIISGKRGTVAATITWYHDQASGYGSSMQTPISLLHNQMNGLNQGDYQHLTAAQVAALTSHDHSGGDGAAIPVAGISATGTPSSDNFLRGDGTWNTITPNWSDLGIYVGVSEPSLKTYAQWLSSRTGYWAWIDISAEVGNPSVSMTGGIVIGGEFTVTRNVKVMNDGGMVIGGQFTVTTSAPQTAQVTMDGGLVIGGQFNVVTGNGTQSIQVSMTGGLVLGGALAHQIGCVVAMTGGLVIGGDWEGTGTSNATFSPWSYNFDGTNGDDWSWTYFGAGVQWSSQHASSVVDIQSNVGRIRMASTSSSIWAYGAKSSIPPDFTPSADRSAFVTFGGSTNASATPDPNTRIRIHPVSASGDDYFCEITPYEDFDADWEEYAMFAEMRWAKNGATLATATGRRIQEETLTIDYISTTRANIYLGATLLMGNVEINSTSSRLNIEVHTKNTTLYDYLFNSAGVS